MSVQWKELAARSHYQTAQAVDEALRRGDVPQAMAGIEELIEAMARSDRRALKSQLIRLMTHVIKWKAQPERRSRSWRATIRSARREIAEIQEETPSLNRAKIESLWDDCFETAKEEAEAEMEKATKVRSLKWRDVFETEYELEA